MVGIKEKVHIANLVEEYKKLGHVEKYFKNGVERLHTYGGSENEAIVVNSHTQTTPDMPQHSPFIERVNRTMVEPVRVMLEEASLSATY